MAEKIYTLIATNNECRFDTDALDLSEGTHFFVVKAKADGYKDSEYSNEVYVGVRGAAKGYNLTFNGSVEDLSSGDLSNSEMRLKINGETVPEITSATTFTNVETFTIVACGNDAQPFGSFADGTDFNEWVDYGTERTFVLTQDLTITAIYK